jgi:putative flippase GtrA
MKLRDQFLRFALLGLIGSAAHFALMIALVQMLNLNAVLAASAGFVAGGIVNYSLARRYVFDSSSDIARTGSRFFLVAVLGLLWNALLMHGLVNLMGMQYIVAQCLAAGVVVGWNFAMNKWWSFC